MHSGGYMADQRESFRQQLAKALAAVGGGVAGHALAGNGQSSVPPELRQLLSQSAQRQQYQNPLFQAATQGAYSMLPTFAKQGTSLGDFNPAAMAGGEFGSGDSGGGINKGAVAGGAGMAALAGLLGKNGAGGSVDLGELFKKIRSMFGGKQQPIDSSGRAANQWDPFLPEDGQGVGNTATGPSNNQWDAFLSGDGSWPSAPQGGNSDQGSNAGGYEGPTEDDWWTGLV